MRTASPTPPARASARREAARRAFTVVELMVVVVIILVLASLTLSGLAVARQRVRIARTKSTIRKLHEIVVPHYESYLRRRVRLQDVGIPSRVQCPTCYAASDVDGSPSYLGRVNAWKALVSKRQLLMSEMPDSGSNSSAECLFIIVPRCGIEPDLMQQFRSDEIGDVDSDDSREFLDGWNQPIEFWRWAPGFSSPLSPVQVANATTHHDPFDPQRVDAAAYALVPLIASGGPDRVVGLNQSSGWGPNLSQLITVATGTIGEPTSTAATAAHRDNITNHDLNVK
jgi:prepilin-type N-terminal cleavage/methylation domain-containing protein